MTAVKEGVDDLGRWKADKAANARAYTVVRGGKEVDVPSKDIRVGDILKLVANDEVRIVAAAAAAVVGAGAGMNEECKVWCARSTPPPAVSPLPPLLP